MEPLRSESAGGSVKVAVVPKLSDPSPARIEVISCFDRKFLEAKMPKLKMDFFFSSQIFGLNLEQSPSDLEASSNQNRS